MTLPDLRTALQELLPHTTIDIVAKRLHVILADPIGVIGIALNADGADYEVGAADVRCPHRAYNRKPPTPSGVAQSIRYEVGRRWSNMRPKESPMLDTDTDPPRPAPPITFPGLEDLLLVLWLSANETWRHVTHREVYEQAPPTMLSAMLGEPIMRRVNPTCEGPEAADPLTVRPDGPGLWFIVTNSDGDFESEVYAASADEARRIIEPLYDADSFAEVSITLDPDQSPDLKENDNDES